MLFTRAAVSTFLLSAAGVAAFSSTPRPAFVAPRSAVGSTSSAKLTAPCNCPSCRGTKTPHGAFCLCAACRGTSAHGASCVCPACRGGRTVLFADVAETQAAAEATEEAGPEASVPEASAVVEAAEADEVPPEVEALDGIASEDEAHNSERPARKSLKKKPRPGKPLSEFKVGDAVPAKVKTLTSYGAFMDFGAQTDGLLHISQIAVGYVSDVKEILQEGQEVEVRITKIDADKNQVGLTLLTEAQEEEAKDAAARPRKQERGGGGGRRNDRAVMTSLAEKGWDPEQFVEGTVVSTVDFGCFVRVDVSQLNSEAEGEMDGLVHISALSPKRVDQVTNLVNANDKVQVRVKEIADGKVALSMISPQDEKDKRSERGGGGGGEPVGAKDWKESLERMQGEMPTFVNRPLVIDNRK